MAYEGLRTDQLKSLIQRTRRGEYADWEGIIISHPLVNCGDDERLFLQFNVNVHSLVIFCTHSVRRRYA